MYHSALSSQPVKIYKIYTPQCCYNLLVYWDSSENEAAWAAFCRYKVDGANGIFLEHRKFRQPLISQSPP